MYFTLLGIISGALPSYLLGFMMLSSTALGVILYARKHTFLFLTALIVGYIASLGMVTYQNMHHKTLLQEISNKQLIATGTVIDIQQVKKFGTSCCITLTTSNVTIDSIAQPISTMLRIYCNPKTTVQIADHVTIDSIIIKESSVAIQNYCMKEGLCAIVFAPRALIKTIYRPSWSLSRAIFALRYNLYMRLAQKMNRSAFFMFSSLFLGNKNEHPDLYDRLKDDCKLWGIAHYLARSGLHMVIFIMFLVMCMRIMPLPHYAKELFFIIAMIIYSLLSWQSLPFNRALWSAILYKLLSLTNRQQHTLHCLSLITCCMLLTNPMLLQFLDFQLSFGFTFALALFHYTAQKAYQRVANID